MKIYLKNVTDLPEEKIIQIIVSERLPAVMCEPSMVQCSYSIHKKRSKYFFKMHLSGSIQLECQRCLSVWRYAYENEHILEEDELMIDAEMRIDLVDIVTDDLHLFLPEKHPEGHCV